MPDLSPTIVGRLFNSNTQFSSANAWGLAMPHTDSTGTTSTTSTGETGALNVTFGYLSSTISVSDIRVVVMSFNTSAISSAPDSATLKVFGKTNTQTGNPSGHSTDGILGLKTTLGATDSLENADWGRLDLSGAAPVLYTDTLTTWNKVGDSTQHNTFTLNSTALTDIGDNDTFQIAIAHKFMYDKWDTQPPFGFPNAAPNSDNDFSAQAGMYFETEDDYKPVLTYQVPGPAQPSPFNVLSGTVHLKGGTLTIK
jgi:hypothetical protein